MRDPGRLPDFLIPAGLVLLGIVPALAGVVRLTQIADGTVTPENARFLMAPLPATLHICAVILFSLLGALQFAPRLRRRWPRWHRWAGRVVVPAGLIAALSGLWMTLFYAWPPMDGTALYLTRLVVGVWMCLSLGLGYRAIRCRDVAAHQDWMLRGYAIGMGAGTQVLTHLPYFLLIGQPSDITTRALLMGAGWAINAALAEWIIARRRAPTLRPA